MTATPPSFKKLPRLTTPSVQSIQDPSSSRQLPVGRLGLDELRSVVKAGLVDTVVLALPNLQGQLKGKRYGARHFIDRVAGRGAEMCKYILATDIDMSPVDGFDLTSWSTGYEDVAVVPDFATLRMVPWLPRTALVLGDAIGPDEQPLDVAPRQILRDQLTQLAAHGLQAQVGLETEFVLYRGAYAKAMRVGSGGLGPVAEDNLDYALDHPPAMDRYFRRLQGALSRAGMPVEAIKTEGAPGQVEITFPYGGALSACDRHLVFKHAVRTLAGRAGMTATFMASPQTGVVSGLHVHVSLTRSGNAMLPTPDGELSLIGKQAVAGLLSALPGLAPLYAPTVNSYKRYVPGSFAPTRMTWGFDNRTCAVRVVGHGDGLHLEVRLAGADANPYTAVSAVLASITHGLVKSPDLPSACLSNAYESADAVSVPVTLDQARSAFRHSPIAQAAFGVDLVEHYAHLSQIELDHHRTVVTDAEQERWFTRA
ncbi:glutamine synthetase family protein [Streptomyces violascens]|uniref:Glutamine synthetase n=1 Tax=Streptomyces violascens TaxID=67381 RepID=A0ABQ3QV40_9ACTN|nr:glutamine synthetase family protein [Streptomyces violascens]GGU43968.1 glutamine synthetase [Streptomyces violascens]GHI41145.1 glutamine synthetase [Streptomyces violascens]